MALRTYSEIRDYVAVQGLIEFRDDGVGVYRPTPEGVQVAFVLLSMLAVIEHKRLIEYQDAVQETLPDGVEVLIDSEGRQVLDRTVMLMMEHPLYWEACQKIRDSHEEQRDSDE